MKNKILFILKKREDYNEKIHKNISVTTGLFNSVSFLVKMLSDNNVENKLVVLTDNNDIDREVTLYKPLTVFIEALWVIPSKFDILQKLHPNITWIIRLHSNTPFISCEGQSLSWIGDYLSYKNVLVACNADKMLNEMRFYASHKMNYTTEEVNKKIIYLPNFYPQNYNKKPSKPKSDYIDVGCYGSVRPLKNNLIQAMAAIKFANSINKKLRFHINDRVEMKGEPVVRNLNDLFEQLSGQGHMLINDGWMDRESFLKKCSEMDLGMQVSFSETFNIVAADLVSQSVPIIGSDEIPWMNSLYTANTNDSEHIIKIMKRSYNFPWLNVKLNQIGLTNYTNKTRDIWLNYFGG